MTEASHATHTITPRAMWPAMLRGVQQRCPACGIGSLYGRFLKVAETCAHCGEALHHQRADDAPPYVTMMIVAHIVVGLLLHVEMTYHPETWVHMVLWGPMTLLLSLWLLPRVKGALIGIQWAARMHGFGHGCDPAEPEVWPPRGTT
jgi:uncharacterized protein (DUF983 family)